MSYKSMTKDNTNSRWLITRVYPTIKHTVTKPSYFDNTMLPPCAGILAVCIFNSALLTTLIVCKTCFVRLPATLR